MKLTNVLFTLAALLVLSLFTACDDDDASPTSGDFTVTIENVLTGKDNFQSGTTGFLMPGESASYSFHAGIGHYLSFATMMVQSNDLFYAPDDTGLALYSGSTAVTGDVTDQIDLWDAGTEVNEEPGVGPNQAPRQSGPNTGADENGTVELISNVNDGYTYPPNNEVIQVTLAHDGGTEFTLTIANVSDQFSFGTPLAPGNWSVHGQGGTPLFVEGQSASSGLEGMAEDGDNSILDTDLTANTGYVSPFAPGAYAVFTDNNPIFQNGTQASSALEGLAEDGDVSGFTNVFNTPNGASDPGPIFPGGSYSFSFNASEGDMLTFATMLVQTNDLFVGPEGIDLFPNGQALSGDITNQLELWDAYTEVNEFPGAGNNQAPRQSGPNTGQDESANVAVVSDGYTYPAVSDMIRVTIVNNN